MCRDARLQRSSKISLKSKGAAFTRSYVLVCEFSVQDEGCWGSTDTACARHSKCGWQPWQGGMGGWRREEGGREVKIAHPFVYNSTCGARTHMQTQRHIAVAALLSSVRVYACMSVHVCVCVCKCVGCNYSGNMKRLL